jgi:hypothetical protein
MIEIYYVGNNGVDMTEIQLCISKMIALNIIYQVTITNNYLDRLNLPIMVNHKGMAC